MSNCSSQVIISFTLLAYAHGSFGFSFEYGGRDAFIDEFFLAAEARGKGHGSEVMRLLDKEAVALGVRAIHLEVERHNVKGNSIYQKSGYRSNNRKLMTKPMGSPEE